jgi:hypothetical protein
LVVTPEVEAARSDLLRLFELVEVDPALNFDQSEPFYLLGAQSPTLLFRGESLDLLRDLQGALAESALARGGPSRKATEELLTKACSISVLEGSEAAIRWIETELAEPPHRWLFAESIQAYLPADELHLGGCRLVRELPPDVVPEHVALRVREHLDPPLIIAEVNARDQPSARLLARDRIDEAVAILVLASGHRKSLNKHVLSRPEETTSIGGGPRVLIAPKFWDSEGQVHPHYRAMSEAAARTDETRTDWERRVLASARWFANGAETFWPSEALTSCMTALESLFIKDRTVQYKGGEIADRLTERWVARGRTVEEQREWFRELWRARNDAIHEGRRFVEDLQGDRLIDFTAVAVRWGAWHLSPYHSEKQSPCKTLAEVMEHDLLHS